MGDHLEWPSAAYLHASVRPSMWTSSCGRYCGRCASPSILEVLGVGPTRLCAFADNAWLNNEWWWPLIRWEWWLTIAKTTGRVYYSVFCCQNVQHVGYKNSFTDSNYIDLTLAQELYSEQYFEISTAMALLTAILGTMSLKRISIKKNQNAILWPTCKNDQV